MFNTNLMVKEAKIMSEKDEMQDHIAWFKREFPSLVRYINHAFLALGMPFGKPIRINEVIREREKFRKMFKE